MTEQKNPQKQTVEERLTAILSDCFNIGNSYHYILNRVKYAELEVSDFEEYDEDTVAEIAAHLIENGVTVHGVMDRVLVVNPTGREVDAILAEIDAGIVSVIPDTEALQMKAERDHESTGEVGEAARYINHLLIAPPGLIPGFEKRPDMLRLAFEALRDNVRRGVCAVNSNGKIIDQDGRNTGFDYV